MAVGFASGAQPSIRSAKVGPRAGFLAPLAASDARHSGKLTKMRVRRVIALGARAERLPYGVS